MGLIIRLGFSPTSFRDRNNPENKITRKENKIRPVLLRTLQNPRNYTKLSKKLGRASRGPTFWSIGWNSLDFVRFGAKRGEFYFIFGLFYFRGYFGVEFDLTRILFGNLYHRLFFECLLFFRSSRNPPTLRRWCP